MSGTQHKEVNGMDETIKETLKKQLELLSKRSEECCDETLPEITESMVKVSQTLMSYFQD